MQHSHREHPGCGEAGGGVFQDEKCRAPHSSPYEILGTWNISQTIWTLSSLFSSCFALQMFQVIQPERALYIQANNCVEARDWIDILTKVSQCNRKRLSTYHPSAYLNGHWLCCKLSADAAPGCTPCTGCVQLLRSAHHHHVLSSCLHSGIYFPVCLFFQWSPSQHSAGCRWRQRD